MTISSDIIKRYPQWFDVLNVSIQLSMEVLPHVKPDTDDNQKLLEAVLYGRTVKSIKAVKLLTEQGMTGDARTILRSCVETVILQRKVALDASFIDKLIERHDYHRRALGNSILADKHIIAEIQANDLQRIKAAIAEIDSRYPDKKPSDINLADVAVSIQGTALYNIFFRIMSGDSAHSTLDSLTRHVISDANGDITGLTFGPQLSDLEDTLSATISVLLHVLDSVIESFDLAAFRSELARLIQRWKEIDKLQRLDEH